MPNDIPPFQMNMELLYNGCGVAYLALLTMAAATSLLVSTIATLFARGHYLVVLLAISIMMPVIVGAAGVVDGLYAAYKVIAMSVVAPKPAELALGHLYSLTTLFLGLILCLPSYLIAVVGCVVKSLITR